MCFLNGFANPAHEARVKAILTEEFPEAYLSIASEVLPQPPEFERTSTVVANAYIGPTSSRYLARLNDALGEAGYEGDVLIMHSGGGLVTADSANEVPVRLAKSGPAAGVIAAAAIGKAIGRKDLISFDMGGTSADIAVIFDGRAANHARVRRRMGSAGSLPDDRHGHDRSRRWLDRLARLRRYPKSGPSECRCRARARRATGKGGRSRRTRGTRTSCWDG